MAGIDYIYFLITQSDPCCVICLLAGVAEFPIATGQAELTGLSGRFYLLDMCNFI